MPTVAYKDQNDGYYLLPQEVTPWDGLVEIAQEEYEAANLSSGPVVLPLQDRIDTFIRESTGGKIPNEIQLESSAASILALHLVTGGTEPDLVVENSAYRQAKQLRAAVAAMRAAG